MTGIDDLTWPDLMAIVEDTPGVLEQLLVHLERTGKIPKQLTRDLAGEKESSDSVDDQADEMSQEDARNDITSRLLLLVSNLRDVRRQTAPKEGRPRRSPAREMPIGQKRADDDPHLWWFPIPSQKDQYNTNTLGGTEKRRIGSLASHIGLRDDEFQQLLDTAGVSKYKQWSSAFGVHVQKRVEGKLTYVALDEPGEKHWSHLPRDQAIGDVYRPAWVGRPKKGWLEGVTEDDIRAAQMSRATLKMIDDVVKGMEASDIMAKLEASARRSRAGIKNNLVKYAIADRTFELPCNYKPVRINKQSDMEEELKDLRQENVSLRAVNDARGKVMSVLEKNAAIGAALASAKDKKQRPQNDVADTLYATMQAVAPKASPGALSKVVPLAVAGFLTSLGIDDEDLISSITNVTPSEGNLRSVAIRAGERVNQAIARIAEADSPIALAFDKGMRAGIDRFVKEMTHFDHDGDKVVSVRINSDGAKGQNSEAAEAIDCSLKEIDKYRTDGKTTRLVGQCTDSGGGGTKEGVAEAISLIDRADDGTYYIATCALHALSKSLQNATEKTFGENGLGEETFLQLLHTCWSAQEALGENFDSEWNKANPHVRISRVVEVREEDVALLTDPSLQHDDRNDKVQKPLLTRWWHVNVCALQVLRTYDAWVKFAKNLYESRSEKNKIKTISQNLVALITSDKLRCDLEFFCAFSHAYWSKHMKWMHRTDEVAKTFGHSSRLMLVRCVLMIDDLAEAKKMNTHHWTSYKSSCEALPDDNHSSEIYGKQTAEKQAERFFKEYGSTLRDNVQRWWSENLLPLAIGGSGPTATIVAQWLLELPAPDLPPDAMKYYDETHECEVDLNRTRVFLDKLPDEVRESVLGDFVISRHEAVIEEKVAAGVDLWGSDVDDDDILALRRDIKSYQVIVKHHTQSTEAGVQEIALCSSSGRDEASASSLSAYRSFFLSPVNAALAELYQDREKKGNRHLGKGKADEREVKSQRAMRRKLQSNSTCKPRGRYDLTSKSHLNTILKKAIESSPTEDESKIIRKQVNKRNAEGDDANTAKKLRLDQEASRRQEDEEKLINRSNNRAQIPDASNINTAKAKPPSQFTKELPISSIRKKDQIKLVLKELEARYAEEELTRMGAYAMTITKLRAAMQEHEDCNQCICPINLTRGAGCKCKKATHFRLEDTEIEDWIDDDS